MNSATALSGYAVYPTALLALSSIWKQMFGIASRRRRSRTNGSSCRNRIVTSNVAPPHISRL